jgi:hypothetical protein
MADQPESASQVNIELTVNGAPIALNDFASGMLSGGILGMIEALRGVESPKQVIVKIESPSEAKT